MTLKGEVKQVPRIPKRETRVDTEFIVVRGGEDLSGSEIRLQSLPG